MCIYIPGLPSCHEHLQILFKIKVVLYMHLDMIAVKYFRLIQFYDTLFELAILYRASGWGICTPIIWLSIKICCRVVENVTFPPEIYALKSICIQFLVKYTTFCIKLPFFR